MGRSSRIQANENRALIIEIASGLFRARGIDAVGIADVMKAAGMTQGGFYRHFESKDALAVEACRYAFDGSVEQWRRVAAQAAGKGENPLEAIIAYYLTPKAPEKVCPMVALASDVMRRPEGDELRRSYGAGVQRLSDTFAAAAAMGGSSSYREAHLRFAGMVGANMLASAVSTGGMFRYAVGEGSVKATL